jgi:hypothetical protein
MTLSDTDKSCSWSDIMISYFVTVTITLASGRTYTKVLNDVTPTVFFTGLFLLRPTKLMGLFGHLLSYHLLNDTYGCYSNNDCD